MTTRSTELLRVAHTQPGITRADAAKLIGVGTGAATEIVARLSRAALLTEGPAAPSGARGRPTTVLLPHPAGPLVLAAAITHEAWRIDVVELGGAVLSTVGDKHAGARWPEVAAALTAASGRLRSTYGGRLRAMGVSVPGTVSPGPRLNASNLGWHDVDLTAIRPGAAPRPAGDNAGLTAIRPSALPLPAGDNAGLTAIRPGALPLLAGDDAGLTAVRPGAMPLLAGNDASLAAAAESVRGAAVGAAVALHLRVEGGLGGAVVDHGRLVTGALGTAGEFGHMPFGDPAVRCPCGAAGCWGTAVDGTALARLLGRPAPPDPVTFAKRVIAAPGPAERAAVRTVATTLGRGIAGLVNGLDADLVTLGGIGADLLAAAPLELRAAYHDGLMTFRRAAPPPVVPAALGDDGPIAGAGEQAWSSLLTHLG